jgi:hypothetical protein
LSLTERVCNPTRNSAVGRSPSSKPIPCRAGQRRQTLAACTYAVIREAVVGGDSFTATCEGVPALQYLAASTYAGVSDAVVGGRVGFRCATAATATPPATTATARAMRKRFMTPASFESVPGRVFRCRPGLVEKKV